VVLAAIGGDKTLTDLVKREDAHHNRITDWKRQLSDHAAAIFAGTMQRLISRRSMRTLAN